MGMTLPSEDSAAEQARSLMARKDAIEAQIEEQGAIIRSHGADMQTPLVDRGLSSRRYRRMGCPYRESADN